MQYTQFQWDSVLRTLRLFLLPHITLHFLKSDSLQTVETSLGINLFFSHITSMSNASWWSASSNICSRITDYLLLFYFVFTKQEQQTAGNRKFCFFPLHFVTSVYADVYSTWLFSCIFRLYRCEPAVGPSSSTWQQLQELYTQVPQVKLHFSHGLIFLLFDTLFLDLSLLYLIMMTFNQSLISAVHAHSILYTRALTKVSV